MDIRQYGKRDSHCDFTARNQPDPNGHTSHQQWRSIARPELQLHILLAGLLSILVLGSSDNTCNEWLGNGDWKSCDSALYGQRSNQLMVVASSNSGRRRNIGYSHMDTGQTQTPRRSQTSSDPLTNDPGSPQPRESGAGFDLWKKCLAIVY